MKYVVLLVILGLVYSASAGKHWGGQGGTSWGQGGNNWGQGGNNWGQGGNNWGQGGNNNWGGHHHDWNQGGNNWGQSDDSNGGNWQSRSIDSSVESVAESKPVDAPVATSAQ